MEDSSIHFVLNLTLKIAKKQRKVLPRNQQKSHPLIHNRSIKKAGAYNSNMDSSPELDVILSP